MAITEYDSLVAAVKSWCARNDSTFSAQIPNFVALAEERLYVGAGLNEQDPIYSPPLRSKVMEVSGTITITDGEGPLPDDLLVPRKLYRASDLAGITYMPPERFDVLNAGVGTGTPVYYTIEGSTLKVTPATADTIGIAYYGRYAAITSSNKAGNLISEHGLIYLEASLYEAFAWMQEQDLALAHVARCRSMVQGVNRTAAGARFTGPLRRRQRVPIP